jgi:hypothetical protein
MLGGGQGDGVWGGGDPVVDETGPQWYDQHLHSAGMNHCIGAGVWVPEGTPPPVPFEVDVRAWLPVFPSVFNELVHKFREL